MPNFEIIAGGRLYRDTGKLHPTLYRVSRLNVNNNLQAASKIDDFLIKKFRQTHGDNWKDELFKSGELDKYFKRATRTEDSHFNATGVSGVLDVKNGVEQA
jgi:hypothetical protein